MLHRAVIVENSLGRAADLIAAIREHAPDQRDWEFGPHAPGQFVYDDPHDVVDSLVELIKEDPTWAQATIVSYDVNFRPPGRFDDAIDERWDFGGLTVVLPDVRRLLGGQIAGEAIATTYTSFATSADSSRSGPREARFRELVEEMNLDKLFCFDPIEPRKREQFAKWANKVADDWEARLRSGGD